MFNFIINAMETPLLSAQQLVIILPVGVVIVLAVLVFAFGFRQSVEPPSFKQLSYSSDDKKSKKKKVKDKKTTQSNGHAVVIEVSDGKKTELKVPKTAKAETPKQKKNSEIEKADKSPAKKEKKSSKEITETKGKKQKATNEKPADFDEGEWKTAPLRKDKKKTKEDQKVVLSYSPVKVSDKSPQIKKEITKIEAALEIKIESKPIEILRIEDILPGLAKKEAAVVSAVVASSVVDIPPVVPVTLPVAEPAAEPVATPVVVPAPAPEAPLPKKKKAKKPKSSTSEDDAVVQAPGVAAAAKSESKSVDPAPADPPQVFNELEDAWKDAPQKKSKKKSRKD